MTNVPRRLPGGQRLALALSSLIVAAAIPPGVAASDVPELQQAVFQARDSVLPALVHVEPVKEVYDRGRKAKAAETGSGVVVDLKGHVLTNDHVVAQASHVKCILFDKREVSATVVGRDPFTDVAVLRLETDDVPQPASLGDSDALTAGEFVIAMGSPLGLARSLSVGVVSTPDRYFPESLLPTEDLTGAYNTWIQTDAAINPGNSGGPLVDLKGRVVGINARAIPIFGENIGFAIPINTVKQVAEALIEHGEVRRSWVGVQWQHVKGLASYFGAEQGGVLVGGIVPDGPAAAAGLRAGDVLMSWDGDPVTARFEEELPAFRKRISDMKAGQRVKVVVLRRGEEVELSLKTARRPSSESDEVELEAWGLTAKGLTKELARRHRLSRGQGAYITGVTSDGAARRAGFRRGDLIFDVEGQRIKGTEELMKEYLRLLDRGTEELLVKVDRGATVRLGIVEPKRQ